MVSYPLILLFLGNLSIKFQMLLSVVFTTRWAAWHGSCHLSFISRLYYRYYMITGDQVGEILFHFPGGCRSSLCKLSQFLSAPPAVGFLPVLQMDLFSPWDEHTQGCLVWGHCAGISPSQPDHDGGRFCVGFTRLRFYTSCKMFPMLHKIIGILVLSRLSASFIKPIQKTPVTNKSGPRENKSQTEKQT